MLNVVALMGRLVADPELRHTPNGVATCTFRIAVDRSFVRAGEERKADFIDIVVWRQTTMSIKSALRSSPARTKLRSTAIRNVHVATPFGVWRSSGSATRRPIKATTFSIILPPFQLSRERLLLSPRSWNAARRR